MGTRYPHHDGGWFTSHPLHWGVWLRTMFSAFARRVLRSRAFAFLIAALVAVGSVYGRLGLATAAYDGRAARTRRTPRTRDRGGEIGHVASRAGWQS